MPIFSREVEAVECKGATPGIIILAHQVCPAGQILEALDLTYSEGARAPQTDLEYFKQIVSSLK